MTGTSTPPRPDGWTLPRTIGAPALLLARSVVRVPPLPEVLRWVWELGLKGVPLQVAALGCVGAVVILDGGRQVQRLFGDPAALGASVFELVVREFGPAFGGIVAATRVGAGVAAELASLRVREQIDALELCGGDPLRAWVSPRLWGAALSILGLGAVGIALAALVGDAAAQWAFGTRPGAFVDPSLVGSDDLLLAAAKILSFAVWIPARAAVVGLQASGGAPAVGQATTRGVVGGILGVLVLDTVWDLLAHGGFR